MVTVLVMKIKGDAAAKIGDANDDGDDNSSKRLVTLVRSKRVSVTDL